MIESYLDVALRELSSRLVWLKSHRPAGLDAEYDVVAQAVGAEVDRLVGEVEHLSAGMQSAGEQALTNTVFRLRELIGEANTIETLVLPALARVTERDVELSKLLRTIHREVKFPLQCPAVTMTSQESFWILGEFHLLAVPFCEDLSPLQFPALYHELPHLLSAEENDSRVQPFQDALLMSAMEILEYFRQQEARSSRQRIAAEVNLRWRAWRTLWTKHWLEEFACDAFAAATAGPAYGWAFAHGAIVLGTDPYDLPGSIGASAHPADAARFKVICSVLEQNGWQEEREKLSRFWHSVCSVLGTDESVEFRQCYPDTQLEAVARKFNEATSALGCSSFTAPEAGSVRQRLLVCWQSVLAGNLPALDWSQ